MRAQLPAGVLLLSAVLATTGCDAVLTTAQLPAVREDAILGEWKDLGVPGAEPEAHPLLIRFSEGMYRVGTAAEFSQGQESAFTLARAGTALIAQSPAEGQCDEFPAHKDHPCWMLNRIELTGDRLNWYDFDADRLARESCSGALHIAHALHRERKTDGNIDTTILLSADAPALGRFLESYATRRKALHLTGRLQRIR